MILMERNIESWYMSFDNAVIKVMWNGWSQLVATLNE